MSVNVKNYFEHPKNATKDDNIANFGGTTTYDGTSFASKKTANVLRAHDAEVFSSNSALNISGVNIITGGTGLAGMTLAAPEPGSLCTIRIGSLSSGTVVVTTASGVTIGGSNNTATFDAAEDVLVLAYASATQWDVVTNIGSVALSTV